LVFDCNSMYLNIFIYSVDLLNLNICGKNFFKNLLDAVFGWPFTSDSLDKMLLWLIEIFTILIFADNWLALRVFLFTVLFWIWDHQLLVFINLVKNGYFWGHLFQSDRSALFSNGWLHLFVYHRAWLRILSDWLTKHIAGPWFRLPSVLERYWQTAWLVKTYSSTLAELIKVVHYFEIVLCLPSFIILKIRNWPEAVQGDFAILVVERHIIRDYTVDFRPLCIYETIFLISIS
jgi:hypothetical protein